MQPLLEQAILEATRNVIMHEVSCFESNDSIKRYFRVFGKIDKECKIIFLFYVTEYFDGCVHLELVDLLKFYQKIHRTTLYHHILLSYFYKCSCQGLKWVYFQSYPPGDDVNVFCNKPNS